MKKMISFGIMRILLITVGTCLLLNGIIYTFLTKINIGSNMLMALSIVMIIYAVFLPRISNLIHIIVGSIFLIPVLFIIFLLIYGNTGKVNYDEDVVIVMGAGVIGDRVSRSLAVRLVKAVEYLNENPDSLIVVTGGLGDTATITEAEAMKRYLVNRGIDPTRIIKEDKSTSSYENLLFADKILRDIFPDGYQAVLISTDFHMWRTKYIASNIGISAVHYGGRSQIEAVLTNTLRELLSIVNVLVFPPWR